MITLLLVGAVFVAVIGGFVVLILSLRSQMQELKSEMKNGCGSRTDKARFTSIHTTLSTRLDKSSATMADAMRQQFASVEPAYWRSNS